MSGSATARVSATDQALAATGLDFDAMEDLPFTGVVATFTDADPNGSIGDFSAIIDWGDGQTSAGVIAALVGGGFTRHRHPHLRQSGHLAGAGRHRRHRRQHRDREQHRPGGAARQSTLRWRSTTPTQPTRTRHWRWLRPWECWPTTPTSTETRSAAVLVHRPDSRHA